MSHKPISQVHLKQIFDNYFIPHWDNDLTCLMLIVYFDIAFFTGNWGVKGLCELRKDSFVLKDNAENREYLELTYNQATKKSRGDDNYEMNDHQIILSQPNASQCPIRSYKMYLSKFTKIPYLFQQPSPNFKRTTDLWYKKSPCGINTIGNY